MQEKTVKECWLPDVQASFALINKVIQEYSGINSSLFIILTENKQVSFISSQLNLKCLVIRTYKHKLQQL